MTWYVPGLEPRPSSSDFEHMLSLYTFTRHRTVLQSVTSSPDSLPPLPHLFLTPLPQQCAFEFGTRSLLTAAMTSSLHGPATEKVPGRFQFTDGQDWFSGHIPVLQPFIEEVRSRAESAGQPVRALELGSWEGRSATWLAQNLCSSAVRPGELTLVDHFDLLSTEAGRERLAKLEHNMRLVQASGECRVRVVKEFSLPGLYSLLQEKAARHQQNAQSAEVRASAQSGDSAGADVADEGGYDFIYVDASHRADDTLVDAELAWRLAREGCIMVLDDYDWATEAPGSVAHPKRGIDCFIDLHSDELRVRSRGYQIVVEKLVPQRIGFLTSSAQATKRDIQEDCDFPIFVAFCIDSASVVPCAVALRSIQEATRSRVRVFVGSMGLTGEDKRTLCQAAPKLVDSSSFLEIDMAHMKDTYPEPVAVWGRLELFGKIPAERVLYLDADIQVVDDLLLLWESSLDGNLIGAARDVGFPFGTPELQQRRNDWAAEDVCFNAGVLLIDLAALRPKLPELLELAKSSGRDFPVGRDQDILNLFLRGKWKEFSLRWNTQGLGTYFNFRIRDGPALRDTLRSAQWTEAIRKEVEDSPGIVHFTGPEHPSLADVINPWVQPAVGKPWGYAGAPGHPWGERWWELCETVFPGLKESAEFKGKLNSAAKRVEEKGLREFRESIH